MRGRSIPAPLARLSALRGHAPVCGDSGSGQGVPPCLRIREHEGRVWPNLRAPSRLRHLAPEVVLVPQRPIVPGIALLAPVVSFGASRTERTISTVSTNDSPQGEGS